MRPTLLLLPPLLTACQVLPDLSQREPSIYIPTVHSPQLEHALNLPPNSDPPPTPPPPPPVNPPQTQNPPHIKAPPPHNHPTPHP